MKKLSPKHMFLAIVALAVLIPLMILGWNEMQKQPLDVTMYGAEITADGTIIQETEFRLNGYLTDAKYGSIIPYAQSYMIYLEPISFAWTDPLSSALHPCESPMYVTGNIHNPYYTAFLTGTDINSGDFREWKLFLCSNMCHCIIKANGRIFIGTDEPGKNPLDVLKYFPEDILQ